MNYFSGLEWVNHRHSPSLSAWKDTVFPDYYVLDFAYSGSIQWGINKGGLQTLHAPVAWWTFPGPHFTFGSLPGQTWDHYFAGFRGPRVKRFIAEGLLPVDREPAWMRITDPERFREAFEALLAALEGPQREEPASVHLLEGLLLQLSEQTQVNLPESIDFRIDLLMRQIWEKPSRFWDFNRAARDMSLSYSRFRTLFKEKAGLPPQQFVLKSRIDAAAKMLRNTRLAVKQIAHLTGFEDIYYFTKMFKKRYHIPPARYRRETLLF